MDENRSWGRIVEDVHALAKQHNVTVPEGLLRVSGNTWERNAKRRAALKEFTEQIPGLPEFADDQPVDQIADVLDQHVLKENPKSEKPSRRNRLAVTEEASGGNAV